MASVTPSLPIYLLIDTEFRALIRSRIEKFIKKKFYKDRDNQIVQEISSIALRVFSSLLAVYIYSRFQDIKLVKVGFSITYLILFVLFLVTSISGKNYFDIFKFKQE
jgi:hypothetical protein